MTDDSDKKTVSHRSETFRAGKALRDVRAQVRRVTFTGNRSIQLDSGTVLRAPQQHWSSTDQTPALFDGLFCIPVVSVELKLSDPLNVPARMTLIGEADNGMVFSREFTFPAGKLHKGVSGLKSSRPVGGVFDLITEVTWRLESVDIQVVLDAPRACRQYVYFVPRWEGDQAPLESVVHLTCRALKGLEPGHPSALDRLWQVVETLDVTAADGKTHLRCAAPVKKQETARDLLRSGSGGAAAWLDLLRCCLELANSGPETTPAAEHSEWPWTVDSLAIREQLLEAKCQHALREMRSS